MLHVYDCDEGFGRMKLAFGSPIDLSAWINDSIVRKICFINGSNADEVCIVTENNTARIFSMVTGQFRPVAPFTQIIA